MDDRDGDQAEHEVEDPLFSRLLLRREDLLRMAIGRSLEDIERSFVMSRARFAEYDEHASYFAGCSGPTTMVFSGGLVHALAGWPSQLSLLVDGARFPPDPYATIHRLSQEEPAPGWLRACLGRKVTNVCVWIFRDDVPSDEPRQAGVSYQLDSGFELFYGTHLHGRLDDDPLLPASEIPPDNVARTVWLADGSS